MHLARDEVHCWYVALDVPPGTEAELRATLSDDERRRSERFRSERHRRRFAVAHGSLRVLLGRYLRTRPSRLRFVHGAFGKPALGPEFGRRLAFNLSHSADLAVVAVARAEVGVDVERVREQPDCIEIARCCFSAVETERLVAAPVCLRTLTFLRSWTRTEARAKARGDGLASPSVGATDEGWTLHALEPASGYVGALAVEGSDVRVVERDWPPDGVADLVPERRSRW